MFQQTIVIGNLGNDPDARCTPSGERVTHSAAVDGSVSRDCGGVGQRDRPAAREGHHAAAGQRGQQVRFVAHADDAARVRRCCRHGERQQDEDAKDVDGSHVLFPFPRQPIQPAQARARCGLSSVYTHFEEIARRIRRLPTRPGSWAYW